MLAVVGLPRGQKIWASDCQIGGYQTMRRFPGYVNCEGGQRKLPQS